MLTLHPSTLSGNISVGFEWEVSALELVTLSPLGSHAGILCTNLIPLGLSSDLLYRQRKRDLVLSLPLTLFLSFYTNISKQIWILKPV